MNAKYASYTLIVDEKPSANKVRYEDRGPDVLRVHFQIYRIPSLREFKLMHFVDATESDRARAEAMIPKIPGLFELWERDGIATKQRHSKGYYYWSLAVGSFVDDPFLQLELEMMIDLNSEMTA